MLTAIISYIILFVSTNIDDLVLLHIWQSRGVSWRKIFGWQVIGIVLLTICSWYIAQGIWLQSWVDLRWLPLGGLIPIYMGVHDIYMTDRDDDEVLPAKTTLLSIILTTLANGSDNIVIYTAFFVQSTYIYTLHVTLGVFVLMTAIRCLIARQTASYTLLHKLNPYLLILVGIYILSDLIVMIGLYIL
jgi:cadmium resistance protein CadD (predicted permease)